MKKNVFGNNALIENSVMALVCVLSCVLLKRIIFFVCAFIPYVGMVRSLIACIVCIIVLNLEFKLMYKRFFEENVKMRCFTSWTFLLSIANILFFPFLNVSNLLISEFSLEGITSTLVQILFNLLVYGSMFAFSILMVVTLKESIDEISILEQTKKKSSVALFFSEYKIMFEEIKFFFYGNGTALLVLFLMILFIIFSLALKIGFWGVNNDIGFKETWHDCVKCGGSGKVWSGTKGYVVCTRCYGLGGFNY